VRDASKVEISRRVHWRTDEVFCDRFQWYYRQEEAGGTHDVKMIPFSRYDAHRLETHYQAWDEGKGEGAQSVTLLFQAPRTCNWKLCTGVTAYVRHCSFHACFGEKSKPVSRCRLHACDDFQAQDKDMRYRRHSDAWTIDFKKMHQTFVPRSLTMKELLAQSDRLQKARQGRYLFMLGKYLFVSGSILELQESPIVCVLF
jgi:hypothetical protein